MIHAIGVFLVILLAGNMLVDALSCHTEDEVRQRKWTKWVIVYLVAGSVTAAFFGLI